MDKQQAFAMIKGVFDQLKLTAAERDALYKALETVSAEPGKALTSVKK